MNGSELHKKKGEKILDWHAKKEENGVTDVTKGDLQKEKGDEVTSDSNQGWKEKETAAARKPAKQPEYKPKKGANMTLKVYEIDVEKSKSGLDTRTTVMIRNLPSKFTRKILLKQLAKFRGTFDFLYLPMNTATKCNLGYAFVNFKSTSTVSEFYEIFQDHLWGVFNSKKQCQLAFGRVQGQAKLIDHFVRRNETIPVPPTSQPLVFAEDGAEISWSVFVARGYQIAGLSV